MSVDLAKYGDVKPLRSYALGMFDMLMHAIYEHKKIDRNLRMPRRFEIHPACMPELLMDRRVLDMQLFNPSVKMGVTFCGVPVVEDVKAAHAKMITAYNTVVYL